MRFALINSASEMPLAFAIALRLSPGLTTYSCAALTTRNSRSVAGKSSELPARRAVLVSMLFRRASDVASTPKRSAMPDTVSP
jgi:hypothetical protein